MKHVLLGEVVRSKSNMAWDSTNMPYAMLAEKCGRGKPCQAVLAIEMGN